MLFSITSACTYIHRFYFHFYIACLYCFLVQASSMRYAGYQIAFTLGGKYNFVLIIGSKEMRLQNEINSVSTWCFQWIDLQTAKTSFVEWKLSEWFMLLNSNGPVGFQYRRAWQIGCLDNPDFMLIIQKIFLAYLQPSNLCLNLRLVFPRVLDIFYTLQNVHLL